MSHTAMSTASVQGGKRSEVDVLSNVEPTKKKQVKTLEERYQKKTPLEHILHRPESYIGSVQQETQTVWVWSQPEERIVSKSITYVPGLYKIFDEILVNAADVKARETHEGRGSKYQTMTYIKVDIDVAQSCITIQNDGEGIPIQIHSQYNVYVPELIFGHLLTSDNYDDSELRVTGGRNGYGAKLTNIFSTCFRVECVDALQERKFVKVWKNNMTQSEPCQVTSCKEKKNYVKVIFTPDLRRFQLENLDEDFVALLTKRVYDVAGCCGLKVFLNGKRLPVDTFKSYVDLYFSSHSSSGKHLRPQESETTDVNGEKASVLKVHEKGPRWEVIISMSEGQFQQVSFVNAIATLKGGTHVNYVTEPLIQAILKKVSSRNKGGMDLKAHQIRAHLFVFLNCLIVNPTFDSQAKETLTTKPSQFGSSFVLSEKTINTVMKSEILETILLWTKMKQQVELQKKLKGNGRTSRNRILGIPKLEDANDAGTKDSHSCTLILTEGESAKTSCIAGLSIVGRDHYGVFSLRSSHESPGEHSLPPPYRNINEVLIVMEGKLLNVREASFKQQIDNQEIQAILKIMGLQVGKKIDSPKGLRYGSLMIMTDQDLDGSHIKGLIINMIAHYWPDLLMYRGFLKEFVTPIVKVSRQNEVLAFFTLREYEMWKEKNNNGKGWKTRYYKGLGTSSDKEFKEYFSELARHSLDFVYHDEEDLQAIDMAFNAKRAEHRKQWIQNYNEGEFVDHSKPVVSYKDFIYKELVQFSRYDVIRSIPNCIDGLKPVQRKVLYACFKRNLKSEIKVAQLVGYISEYTAYHHGEQSLGSTIIAMAQTFVGSNNINLLQPCGQFGSRKEGGKDASATRYIFTRLSPVTRALFPEADDPLLEYQNDDGMMVEPKYYVPILPLALINGVEGIGTGWSSSIPNYNPYDLIRNIRLYLRKEPMCPMIPWYRGFTGRIVEKVGGFESIGTVSQIDEETLSITELPVKVWTQTYRQFLEDLVIGSNTAQASDGNRSTGNHNGSTRTTSNTLSLVDYRDNSSHETINFTVKVSPETMLKLQQEGFEKCLKLRKSFSTMNMTLFDHNLKVQRYASELDIVKEFAHLRYQFYELRRAYCIEKIRRECRILKNKVSFIKAILEGTLTISNRRKDDIIRDLTMLGFDTYASILQESALINRLERQAKGVEGETEQDNETSNAPAQGREFEYLLGMSLWSLSFEKIEELKHQEELKRKELQHYEATTPEELWENDLDVLEHALAEQERNDAEESKESTKFKSLQKVTMKSSGKKVSTGKTKTKSSIVNHPQLKMDTSTDKKIGAMGSSNLDQLWKNKDSDDKTQSSYRISSQITVQGKPQDMLETSSSSTSLTEPQKNSSMSLSQRVMLRKEIPLSNVSSNVALSSSSSSSSVSKRPTKSLRELLGIESTKSQAQTELPFSHVGSKVKSRGVKSTKSTSVDVSSSESDTASVSFLSLASSSSISSDSSSYVKPRRRLVRLAAKSSPPKKSSHLPEAITECADTSKNQGRSRAQRGRGGRRLKLQSL